MWPFMNRIGGREGGGTHMCLVQQDLERGEGAGYTTTERRHRFGMVEPAAHHALLSAVLWQEHFAQTKIRNNTLMACLTLNRCLGKARVTCSGAFVAPAKPLTCTGVWGQGGALWACVAAGSYGDGRWAVGERGNTLMRVAALSLCHGDSCCLPEQPRRLWW